MAKFSMVALVIGALVAVPAAAADMPPAARPRVVADVYQWSGWYVGGNIGYGWANDTGAFWDAAVDNGASRPNVYFAAGGNVLPGTKPSGVFGGAQVGFDHRATNWVLGIAADIQASDMQASATRTISPAPGYPVTIHTNNAGIDWFGTARGRVGYAAGNFLLYGTGGLAYGAVKANPVLNCTGCPVPAALSGTTSTTRMGWTAGAGIEVGLSSNWTMGVEYLHIDLGSVSTTSTSDVPFAVGSSVTANSGFAADLVRATLNYKFSPAVVIAKY